MSEVGRYRLVYPRIWRHAGFIKLNKSARELTLYLLTGPQTNRIGLFHFSIATAAEDLGVGVETLRERLADVLATFGWLFDADARLFFIPSWWRWNRPQNENVLTGNLKDLAEIASSGLVDAFTSNLETLPDTLHATFVECCRKRLSKRSPIQDQEPFPEQESRAKRSATNDVVIDNSLKAIAIAAVRENPRASREDLIDHVLYLCRGRGDYRRTQVEGALNQAFVALKNRAVA